LANSNSSNAQSPVPSQQTFPTRITILVIRSHILLLR
jgi:hypothetical protein